MLKVENLTKKYGDLVAVDTINFHVSQGEVIGLLGANGAGKSTIMNMITGYIKPTLGDISIFHYNIKTDPISFKRHIGYLPEIPPLYLDMTVREQLEFVCGIKFIPKKNQEEEIDRVCGLVNILDHKNRMIKNLSKGYRQRIGIAQALVNSPDLLILDEPTAGLDPQQILDIKKLIEQLKKNHSIIISSHVLSEISSVCNKIMIIKDGKLLANDTPKNLEDSYQKDNLLQVRVKGSKDKVISSIGKIEGILDYKVEDSVEKDCFDYLIQAEKGIDIREDLFFLLSKINSPIVLMKYKSPTLEDIFIELTT